MTSNDEHEHSEALLLRDAMIAGLAGAASDLAEVGHELYLASVLTKVQRIALFVILALVAGMCAGLLVVAKTNLDNGKAIRSCTDPKGECYKRSDDHTGKVVQLLLKQSEADGYCSQRASTQQAYRACIHTYVNSP